MRRSRIVASALAALLAATSGYAVLDAYDRVPGVLTISAQRAPSATTGSTGSPGAGGSPSGAGGSPSGAGAGGEASGIPVAQALAPLAALSSTAPVPTGAGLRAKLAGILADKALGGSVGIVVRDALTSRQLFARNADTGQAPASTVKLLTAAASLAELGASATARTTVVRGSSSSRVVLVAGGDSLLAPGKGDADAVSGHAGLGDLAAQVAARLRAAKVGSVQVGLDDHAAKGPSYGPQWLTPDINAGFTGPVAMLGLSTRRAGSGRPAPSDPAKVTAQAFAKALRAAGITVSGSVERTRAPAHAATLGVVQSATVAQVLQAALSASDNALTESVARRAAARAGAGTSFAAVAGFVVRGVKALGIDTTGVHLVDSCGLSRGTKVPARVLADVLDLGAEGRDPALQQVVRGLPVAGLTGTLRGRFGEHGVTDAAGVARAKSGTLTGVSALAGTVVDEDGRLLTFVALADKVPTAPTGSHFARVALDHFVATLAACGCR